MSDGQILYRCGYPAMRSHGRIATLIVPDYSFRFSCEQIFYWDCH